MRTRGDHPEADQAHPSAGRVAGVEPSVQYDAVAQLCRPEQDARREQVGGSEKHQGEAGESRVVRVGVHIVRYGASEQTFHGVPSARLDMDRQQLISLLLVGLMLMSSIAYAASVI